jgi:siroheme synthase-like protein
VKCLVVKTGDEESSVTQRLRAEGNQVDELTVGRIVELSPVLPPSDWVVVTSRHAAFATAGRRVAAIGPRTADAVEKAGGKVAFCAAEANSASFLEEFSKVVKPKDRVVRLKPQGVSDTLKRLANMCDYVCVDAYVNNPVPLPQVVDLSLYDAAYFTSPSAVERLSNVAAGRTKCHAIGPSTEAALSKVKWQIEECSNGMFPMFIDLTGKRCLVVGSGAVAKHKAQILSSFGARVDVLSPEVNRAFKSRDVEGFTLVVAATDNREVNALVANACRERNIPVNAVDDAANCTFFFPSIVRKGPLVAAVSSGGNCPAATQVLRDAIAPLMTDGLVNETIRLGAMRDQLKKEFPDHTERGKYCREQLEKSW